MMNKEAVTGDVMRATAGGEKGKLFFLIGQQDGFLLLVDGKRHKLGSPKRKNAMHAEKVCSGTEIGELLKAGAVVPDRQLRRALAVISKCPRS